MWLKEKYNERLMRKDFYASGLYKEEKIVNYLYQPYLLIFPLLAYAPLIFMVYWFMKFINPLSMVIPFLTQIIVLGIIVGYFVPFKPIRVPIRYGVKGLIHWIKHPFYTIVIILDFIICSIPTLIVKSIKKSR